MYLTPTEEARFQSRFKEDGSCHTWRGYLDKDGYGTFYLRRKTRKAHRVAWFRVHGEIPDGLVVNHRCGNRACVNVEHLNLLTIRGNVLIDSRSPGAINAKKTHCKYGHPLDRVYGVKKPQRYCSICEREKGKRLRKKWLAEANRLKV